MSKEIKNLPASIRSRLEQVARKQNRPFQEIFFYYAMERFLYRLSQSPYHGDFILKGGLMFLGWGLPLRRPTRDIDVQGFISNNIDDLVHVVIDICVQQVDPDGLRFDPESVHGERIMENTENIGVRVHFRAYLGNAWLGIHMDISFGSPITPSDILVKYPTTLNMPAFYLRGYPVQTAIAEKLHAMVFLETANDRIRDFYDLWLLARQVEVHGPVLVQAIAATFQARRTPIPVVIPIALTDQFAQDRQPDWARFVLRSFLQGEAPGVFSEVNEQLRRFLMPPLQAARDRTNFNYCWKRNESWEEIREDRDVPASPNNGMM